MNSGRATLASGGALGIRWPEYAGLRRLNILRSSTHLKPLSEGNRLRKGDLLRIVTAGGGGWGSPLERPAEQVLADVLDGVVSPDSARNDYGVVLSDDLTALDAAATQALRAALPAPDGMFHRREYFDDIEPPPPKS